MVPAYKFFFCGVPDNQHWSTPCRAWWRAQCWAVGGPPGRPPETRPVGLRRLAHIFFLPVAGWPGIRPDGGGLLMRLLGSDLACFRGGRQVFSGLSFTVAAGEALVV